AAMLAPGVCMNIISARHSKDGYGTVSNPEKFLNQDFQQLKEYCLIRRVRFIDDMFPPDHRSIGRDILQPADLVRVEWVRPSKIVPKPSFIVDGVSRFDFGQGLVGNCWFLASIGALTFQDFILKQVVPLEQTFDEDYCGLFHFRFWRFGKWVDVVIDDKLPTINGQLIFVHSKNPTEFWPALLEKAYAKVCGSYSDMNAGTPVEAMVDFTGGVHMCVQLSEPPADLWELMCRAGQAKSLMGCGTPQGTCQDSGFIFSPQGDSLGSLSLQLLGNMMKQLKKQNQKIQSRNVELLNKLSCLETSANTVLPNGLVQGHAYAVTGVREVLSRAKAERLVRLWNPWGQGEWSGDWSDRSSLWQTVSPQDRETCLSVCEDGEFWMTLQDFCKFYSDLDICCSCVDFLDGSSSCHWKSSFHEGRWVAGISAGGCMNHPETFWTNPQYRVEVGGLQGGCADSQGENNMLVSLMQKPDKRNRRLVQNLHIGFSVFEVPKEYRAVRGKFPAVFFGRNKPVAQMDRYTDAREVMQLLSLKPGEFLIVPSTFNPNETASFILPVLSKAETHVHESSGGNNPEQMETEKPSAQDSAADEDNNRTLFRQFSDKYEEVDAEQLQSLLNGKILRGDLKSGGFSTDACRSMVALMDTSITGKLNSEEFVSLWRKIVTYKDIFSHCDVSRTGTLSLSELRKAIMASGKTISDDMLNVMALRYGASSGFITLENFIALVLRFDRMSHLHNQADHNKTDHIRSLPALQWMYLVMYS
uniref:Calpain catalytic domain-containing protein n=1 Tax=Poecilia formosa TaxID=48698 RepID=A0A087XVY0_POEFO